jgi:DNA-binding MarR family transcriptional regulator/predicted GNAT family N-acyltransferase
MDFFETAGIKAIGSRLRMLTNKVTNDAAEIYRMYGIEMQPKWFPVFFALGDSEGKTITTIAAEIGHSHPSVSKIISEMIKNGLVNESRDTRDARKNIVSLSQKGLKFNEQIKEQYTDVEAAVNELNSQANHNLWKALEEWEYLLDQKSLLRRVAEQRKERLSSEVKIVDYQPEHAGAFKNLNVEWISTYFKMEEADHRSLDDPDGYILRKGGHILVALINNEPVGVCALLKINAGEYDFELAKMAVSPRAQGRNIGWLLGTAALNKARSLKANKVYLESNTILKPAINLYNKLGFRKVVGNSSPYERCNIQMAIELN